jgi:hypothetical protein
MKPPSFLRIFVSQAIVAAATVLPMQASAEVQLSKTDTWEVFMTGRAGGFLSSYYGQTVPVSVSSQGPGYGGTFALSDVDTSKDRGTISGQRVRSGFVASVLAFGLRRAVTDYTKATAYFETWSYIMNESRQKNAEIPVEMRQAYMQLEGPWGTFTVGRQHALFSRGATDTNYLYGHAYGLGIPFDIDGNGPGAGHIGFGVLAHGFSPGFVYATPVMEGLQLTVGLFDPSKVTGQYNRTSLVRPEAELTYEHALGSNSKIFFFGNGAFERLYKDSSKDSTDAWGLGYGARLELGPLHLGVAGHYGKVLGLNYAFQWTQVGVGKDDKSNEFLRKFDGYYVQSQFILSQKLDVSLGWGTTRVYQSDFDVTVNPDTSVNPQGNYPINLLKQQVGYSGGFSFHPTDFLHFTVDYFLAQALWYGVRPGSGGDSQIVHFVNVGSIMTF